MATIEIQNQVSEDKMKMAIDVLKAIGIKAVFRVQENDIKMNKEDFIRKIEKARKSSTKKISVNDQSKMLGL